MTDSPWCFGPACDHVIGTDLSGWTVEATDGRIGEVDEHSDERDDAYLVVDAGAWIFGKLLIPAGAVARMDHGTRTIHLSLTTGQVEDAPQYLSTEQRGDPQYRADLVAYYWKAGPC